MERDKERKKKRERERERERERKSEDKKEDWQEKEKREAVYKVRQRREGDAQSSTLEDKSNDQVFKSIEEKDLENS